MIRRASADEAALLTTIALDASRYWGYPEHWIKHWETELTVSPDFIRRNQVYVAEEDGEVRGFYALRAGELEHLWVRPAFTGSGIGKALLIDAIERKTGLVTGLQDLQDSQDKSY